MQHIIEVHGLHKHFGHVHALDGLALSVDAGEIHGFLGPNGSGKSTTIRVLLGILRATAGQARLLGRDPWSEGSRCTVKWLTCRAMSRCGRPCPVAKQSTCWHDCAAGSLNTAATS